MDDNRSASLPATPSRAAVLRALGATPVSTTSTARNAVDIIASLGHLLLTCGLSASDTAGYLTRAQAVFGIDSKIDITFTSLIVAPGPTLAMRHVPVQIRDARTRVTDYRSITRAVDFTDTLENWAYARSAPESRWPLTDHDVEDLRQRLARDAASELARITDDQPAISTSMRCGLLAVMAAGVALLLGGPIPVIALSAALTASTTLLQRAVAPLRLPAFYTQMLSGCVASAAAVGLFAASPLVGVPIDDLSPSLVVASGIVVFLAGMSFLEAMTDAIRGYPVTALAQIFEVAKLTFGLVIGVVSGLAVGERFGVGLIVTGSMGDPWPLAIRALGASAACAAWALTSRATVRSALTVAAAGALGYIVQTMLVGVADLASPPAAAVSAGAIAAYASFVAKRFAGVPQTVTIACGCIPLLPGLSIYQGLVLLSSTDNTTRAAQLLISAAGVATALGTGAVLLQTLIESGPPNTRPIRKGN